MNLYRSLIRNASAAGYYCRTLFDPPGSPIKAKRRNFDISVGLLPLAGFIPLAIFNLAPLIHAILATLFVALMIYFLLDLAFTFVRHEKLSNRMLVLLNLLFTALLITAAWNYYFRNEYHKQQAALVEGDLTPEGLSSQGASPLEVGSSGMSFSFGSDSLPPDIYRTILQAKKGPDGLLLTTHINDRDGNLVAQIKDNHWRVYPNHCSEWNYTANSLEVLDSSGEVVLQAVLTRPTAHIQGIWRDKFGRGVELLTDENGKTLTKIQWGNPEDERRKEEQISPMFKYPSSEHWGEKIPRLVVDDFELSKGMTVINKSDESLVALRVTAEIKSSNHMYTRNLGFEVGPHKTAETAFPGFNWVTLPSAKGSFDDQWKSANTIYPGCVGVNFYSETNQDLGVIGQYYRKTHIPHDEAVGVIIYRAKNSKTVTTTEFPLDAYVIRVPGCTYVKGHGSPPL